MKLKTEHYILGAAAIAVGYAFLNKQSAPAVGAKKRVTPKIKAEYIVANAKNLNKTLSYALDDAIWHTMTDKEQKEVEKHILKMW